MDIKLIRCGGTYTAYVGCYKRGGFATTKEALEWAELIRSALEERKIEQQEGRQAPKER